MPADILIVDDEADIRNLIKGILEDEGYATAQAENIKQVFERLAEKQFQLVILDIWLQNSEFDGLAILEQIKEKYPEIPVLMISGHGTIETAVKAIKQGAYDFIEKPFKTDRLLLMIDRALETSRLKQELADLRQKTEVMVEMVGKSPAMFSLLQTINKVAATNSRVLISGPAGVGKEMAARFLHKQSSRADRPFMLLSCAMLTPERIELELFGQEANGRMQAGFLERADGGTLLLDEVSDMPLETQGKILRVLQDQTYKRLGGAAPIKVDVRVMASTSRNLQDLIDEGKFREDLYYRLNVVPLAIPALRERADDIPVLIEHFMAQYAGQSGLPHRKVSEGAMAAMRSYAWPGNIRQLRNLIEWMMIVGSSSDEPIQTDDLPPEIAQTVSPTLRADLGADLIAMPLREAREIFEREYLVSQVNRFGGNISRTAQFIGMERSALHRKLKGLNVGSSDKEDAKEDHPDSYDQTFRARA